MTAGIDLYAHQLKRRLSFNKIGMMRPRSRSMQHRRLPEVGADDDSSTSSTMSTGLNSMLNNDKKKSTNHATTSTSPVSSSSLAEAREDGATTPCIVKRVRFGEEPVKQTYKNVHMFKDECKSLWYQPTDYRRFKKSASALAREIALSEARNKAPCSYRRVLLSVYESCCQANVETQVGVLTDEQERHLKRWMDVSTSRLGTEKLSVRPIGRDRTNRRNDLMELVFEIQDMTPAPGVDASTKAEFIRKTCEAISRAPRLFARHLAEATAASIY